MSTEIEYDRYLVHFWDLTEEWQEEARSNNDEDAENCVYVEPLDTENPTVHVLQDLNLCIPVPDSEFDGVIGVSNNSAIGVHISPCGGECKLTYI